MMEIRLREIREDDLAFLNQCRNNYAVSKYLHLFAPSNLLQEKAWFETKKNEVHFIVEISDHENAKPAGQVSLIHFSNIAKSAELTIFLEPEFSGKGLGVAAIKLMIDYGFRQLNLNKIFAHIYSFNESSRKAFTKAGFSQEGRLRDFVYKDGAYHDAYYFGILHKEFFSSEDTRVIQPLLYRT